jgi:hypothetical protein
MKKIIQKSRKWVLFVAVFALSTQYTYAAEAMGVCNGQPYVVVVHHFLGWSWGHVEDPQTGDTVSDECGLVDQLKERLGYQQ